MVSVSLTKYSKASVPVVAPTAPASAFSLLFHYWFSFLGSFNGEMISHLCVGNLTEENK